MSQLREKLIPARDLVPCTVCGRNFNTDRIQIHQTICQKSNANVRRAFDITQQRVRGTEAEKFMKPSIVSEENLQKETPVLSLNTNWRQRHEEFMSKVKDAKAKLKEANEKKTDLPYPPPIDLKDYPECPYCMRQINQQSFEKHQEICRWFSCKETSSKKNLTLNSKSKISLSENLE